MPIVSIIVPVYNNENVISRCLDSILKQTYIDFELLLVNDGSTDRSGDICDQYSMQDARVKVYHKSNAGVSSARNLALRNVQGQWILFVDSDDWIDEMYVESLLSTAEDYDLIIGSATITDSKGVRQGTFPNRSMSINEFYNLFVDERILKRTSPWAKLFRRDIISVNKLYFPEGMHIGEDAVFLYTYLLYCNNVKVIDNRHYHYVLDSSGSLTKRLNSVDAEIYALTTISTSIDMLIKRLNIRSERALANLHWLRTTYIHRVLNSLYCHNTPHSQRIQIIKRLDVKSYCNYYLQKQRTCYNALLGALLKLNLIESYDLIRRTVKFIKYREIKY